MGTKVIDVNQEMLAFDEYSCRFFRSTYNEIVEWIEPERVVLSTLNQYDDLVLVVKRPKMERIFPVERFLWPERYNWDYPENNPINYSF